MKAIITLTVEDMESHRAGEHRTRMESQAFGCQTSPLEEQGLLFSEHPSLIGGELWPRPALLPGPGIPERERKGPQDQAVRL